MSPKQFPVVCDGYVKYEQAQVDILVASLIANNSGGSSSSGGSSNGGGSCGLQ